LKLTDAQKKQYGSLTEQQRVRLQKARADHADINIFLAARNANQEDHESAIQRMLEPGQRERLEQIQLQVQGPVAFEDRLIRRRLKLSAEQADDIEAIANDGTKELATASSFPIALEPGEKPEGQEAIRALVSGLPFQLAKEKARHLVLAGRAGVMLRIVAVLTVPQRAAYRTMLGAPFDVEKIGPTIDATERDVRMVARALGLAGQRADSAFDVKIAHPAYTMAHPRVLIDEAHRNFHTYSGRYQPFASLIANDGYQVSPNRDSFTTDVLRKCEILVVANARGSAPTGMPGAVGPAFTDDECQAVRDWVKAGGALLLITDHNPFGASAENLGKQFKVEMSKASVADPANVEPDVRGLLFSRDKKLVGDHPITRGRSEAERVNRVRTFTGQGLKGPIGSTPLLIFARTATVGNPQKPVSASGQSQGLALKFGKGRVVVLGEAAQLSAQLTGIAERNPRNMMGMNAPGSDNRQFALNILHWLSGLLDPAEKTNGTAPGPHAVSATPAR
jgi:hypothetical protein